MSKLIRTAIERPRSVLSFILLLVLGMGSFLTNVRIDTDPENMLSSNQPDRVFHNEVEERFGLHDAIIVGIVNSEHPNGIFNAASLAALHSLSRSILDLEGVIGPDLMSLAQADNITQEGDGVLRFEWMMNEAPVAETQALEIRDQVRRLPLLQDTLVSGDGKAAAIYVPIVSKDLSYSLSQQIQKLTEGLDSSDGYHITGLPVAEDTFGHDMFIQMGISAPLAGLMIYLLMLYFFRSARLVTAPMLVAMATVILTMGLLTAFGFSVHIMSSMIPIFLMPIAVVDSVHIMSEFADTYREGDDVATVIGEVVEELFTPMLFTSLTSALGFFSLLLTPIPPVQVFGVFVATGVLLAFLLTIVLIPAYVVCLSPATLQKMSSGTGTLNRHGGDTKLARSLRWMGQNSVSRGRAITVATMLLLAVSFVGIQRIQINDNPVRWFKKDHPIRIADEVLNRHFAGTYDAFLVLQHEDPKSLSQFRDQARSILSGLEAGVDSVLTDLLDQDTASPMEFYDDLIVTLEDALFEAKTVEAESSLERLLLLTESAQQAVKYFQKPESLALLVSLQQELIQTGKVGKTNALPDIVKVVNRELHGGLVADYQIPRKASGVAQTLLQYQSSHRPQDLWHMVTPDYSQTAIWLQLRSGDNQEMTEVLKDIDEFVLETPLPEGVTLHWAGKTYINVIWQDAMVKGMLKSLVGAFIAVLLIMTALFKSWRLGLLAMVPLSLTIVGVYGAIGWIGKDYDMPIAVLSSLTLGLSVDFAIHFIARARTLVEASGSFAGATDALFEEPARAIGRNAIVIAVGFTPLFFAPLMPYITVGAFMAAIMALSGLATLVLLPAILSWGGGWFFPCTERDFGLAAGADISASPSTVHLTTTQREEK